VFSHGSKNRLTSHDLGRFPSDTLFDRVGRAVCGAGCLPRKELFEAWETARRVRRQFRGGRVVDLAAGHGLLGQLMLILDDSSPKAAVVDRQLPGSVGKLRLALEAEWPRLARKVAFVESSFEDVAIHSTDLVVSNHACGRLTDTVLERAAEARARVAVLPCCHDLRAGNAGGLGGWMSGPLAIDVTRARWLAAQGYRIWTQTIPEEVTPKNRLLMGEPI